MTGAQGWDGRVPGRDGRGREPYESARQLGSSLEAVARRLGMTSGTEPVTPALTALFSHWGAVVGDAVAQHANPVRLRDGVLTIEVDHPSWATQLRMLSQSVIDAVNAEASAAGGKAAVTSLEIRVARGAGGGHSTARSGHR